MSNSRNLTCSRRDSDFTGMSRCGRDLGTSVLTAATVLALVGLLATSLPARGQNPVASASMEPLPSTAQIDAATRALNQLNRVISVRVENEQLDNVLQDIARKAGLQLFYGDEAISGVNDVSITLEKTTALAALYEVIRGRSLKLLITPSGHLIVAPDPEAVPPAPAEDTAKYAPTAQEGSITGHVTDENGESLPGVNVAIINTTQGAATDAGGNYTISGIAPGIYSVQASFIGYETEVVEGVEVGEDEVTVLDIQMQPRAMGLDEVVVIGYGTVSARDLTGSVATVDVEDALQSPSIRIDQLLQGRAPGVHVTSTTGEPGAGTTIRIRGSNSISASNEPLYVIDGVIGAGDLNSINPDDIASIDVLKDATATAIYGARGSNGVVLVTTKRGRAGEPQIDMNLQRGWQTLPRKIDMLNATEYAELMNEWEMINGREPAYANPAALGEGTDWQDEITRTAPLTDFNLSVRGGIGGLRYFVSGNYFDQRGIIINSGIERYQFRLNLDAELNDRLTIGNTLNVAHVDRRPNSVSLGGTNSSSSALGAPPTMPVYEESGDFASEHPFPEVNGPINNPVAQGLLPIRQVNSTTVLGNLFAQYQLLEGLSFKSSLGVDAEFGKSNSYTPITLPRQAWSGDGGEARVSSRQGATILTENTLNYNKAFGSDHRLNAVAGFTYQTSSSESVVARASGFRTDVTSFNDLASGDPITRDVDSGYSDWSIISYLGRVNYTLMDRYLFTIVARQDGSSRLGANNKYAFFPAAAFAWRISDEPFLRDLGLFSNLKLRTSYGLTGNQAVGIYQTLPTLEATSVVFGGVETPAYVSDRLPNPDLKWETTRQLDIGLEAGFLGGRVQLEMDYYNTQTDDLLLEVEIPTQSGYSSRLENIGQIENEGFEVALDALVADTREFVWEFNANVATNRNRVVDLGDKDEVITYVYPHGTQPMGLLREGEPVGSFHGAIYEGTWKSQDEIDRVGTMPTSTPGSPRFKDLDGDGTFGQDDYTAIGNANPKFFGGLGSTFRYKDAEINFFFQGQYGGEIMNGGTPFFGATHPYTNQFGRATERWSSENPDSNVPGIQPDARPRYVATDLWLHDATHLRLKTLRVAYSLPVRQLGISDVTRSARIYVMGTNLWLWDTYDDGYDPEVSGFGTSSVNRGYDFTEYPRARSVTVGVQLGF